MHLKGKMLDIHMAVQKRRSDPKGGIDIGLEEYLREEYSDVVDLSRLSQDERDSSPYMAKLLADLEIGPSMTVDQVLNSDDDTRWIVPEVYRQAIRKGFRESPFYTRLVIREERIAQPTLMMPYINLSDAEPQALGEGQSIAEGTLSYGHKSVSITKEGLGISMTYEAIQYTPLSLAAIFMQDFGVRLGLRLCRKFIDVLINGDQADGSNAATIVGVYDPTALSGAGLTYQDELSYYVRGSQIGRNWNTIIAGALKAEQILNITEHKQPFAGNVQSPINLQVPLPASANLYVHSSVPADQDIRLDPRSAVVQLTSAPLLIESEQIIKKQLRGTYTTITTGFAIVQEDARIVVDSSLTRTLGSTNDFPASFNPLV